MSRYRKPAGDPEALHNAITCMFTDGDIELINRVRKTHGISRAAAVRMMMRSGAYRHDPFTPKDEDEQT